MGSYHGRSIYERIGSALVPSGGCIQGHLLLWEQLGSSIVSWRSDWSISIEHSCWGCVSEGKRPRLRHLELRVARQHAVVFRQCFLVFLQRQHGKGLLEHLLRP